MYITPVYTKTKSGDISHTCWLMRHNVRDGHKVKTKTLLNLTPHCTPEEIEAIKLALKHKGNLSVLGSLEDVVLEQGPSVGAVWLLYQLAREIGLVSILGQSREGLLAMWQIMARIIDQGSRLSAVRLAGCHAVCDILGIREAFNEDDLYANLSWLSKEQPDLEQALYRHRYGDRPPILFLYDVTSSYLEGERNALSEWGYNRDGKKGKRQVVVGLMCDDQGDPVSVEVFKGNTSDPQTMKDQVDKAANRFGCKRVIFVGDRGMIKSGTIKDLNAAGFSYITAITKPQIETLLKDNVIQMDLFSDQLCEVMYEDVRYVLRRNRHRVEELAKQRSDKQAAVAKLVEEKNAYLTQHNRASIIVAERLVRERILKLKLSDWLSVESSGRALRLVVDDQSLVEQSRLDGCYVIKSDVTTELASGQTLHDRYKELKLVESAFRTCKTGFLEMRPWFVRTEESTRAHAFVVMLAYLLVRRLTRLWDALNVTVEEGIQILGQLSAVTLRLPGRPECYRVPNPTNLQQQLLAAAQVPIPEIIPKIGVNVVSRKERKRKHRRA